MSKVTKVELTFESQVIDSMTFEFLYSGSYALTVKFNNGSAYLYPEVNATWITDFIETDSVGHEFSIFKKCQDGRTFTKTN